MNYSKIALLFFVFGLFTLGSCVKPPNYPNEPEIEYIGLNKNVISQGNTTAGPDTLVIFFSFTDGDGDLGFDGDSLDVFLTDSRDQFKNPFKLPVIPDEGIGNGISGEITFRLLTTCCVYPPNSNFEACEPSDVFPVDTLVYEIYMMDRAGNESNRILTDPIFLQCDTN